MAPSKDSIDAGLVLDFTSVGPGSGGVGVVASGVAMGLLDGGAEFSVLTTTRLGAQWTKMHPKLASRLRTVSVSLDATSGWQARIRKRLPRTRLTEWAIGIVRHLRARSLAPAVEDDVVWAPFHRVPVTGSRAVITVHDLRVFEPALASPMDQRIIAENIARAAAVVCSWPHPYRSLIERYPAAAAKAFMIPLPVLNPGPPTERTPPRPDAALRLLYPGYVTVHKNHEVVIRALASRPSWTVVFTGTEDRDHGEQLRALATSLGVAGQIQWRGFVSFEELESEYRAADLLVMPTRWEAASGPVYEAIVRELPFIASDIPPITSQLSALGLPAETFRWNDPDALVTAVDRTVADYTDHLRSIAGVAEQLRARTWRDTADEYSRVFAWASGSGEAPVDLRIG